MPGLLDLFSSDDPQQNQSLLAGAAKMLELSGPSLMPRSFGQIAGAATGAYYDTKNALQDRQQRTAQADQLQQLRGLQIQDAQGSLSDQQRARARADQLSQFYTDYQKNGPGQLPATQPQGPGMPGTTMPPFPQGGLPPLGGNTPDWMQAYMRAKANGTPPPESGNGQDSPPLGGQGWQASPGGQPNGSMSPGGQIPASWLDGGMSGQASPATRNSAGFPALTQFLNSTNGDQDQAQAQAQSAPASRLTPPQSAQSSQQPPAQSGQLADPYQQHMAIANALRSKGFMPEADAHEAAALKFRPKFSTDFKVARGTDGQLHNYVLSDDGAPPRDVGLGVKPDLRSVDLGGSQRFYDANTMTPGTSFQKTATPGEQLDYQSSQGGGAPSLTDGAIENAARRYMIDGTLPPMGMGKAGTQGRSAILNKAAEFAAAAGTSSDQQRWDQLNNKGVAAARTATLRDFSPAGKSGQAVQAANTALNHLATIRQLAQAQANGDTPTFNRIANAWSQAMGTAAPTNLQAAITMVAPEVSKSVIGAAGGQEERAQFAKNFNPNGSPQQTLQGIGVIQDLLGGRLTEAQRSYERGTGQADFAKAMLSPAAQQVLARAHASSAPAGAAATSPSQFQVTAPNGKTYRFQSAKDLANFKLTSGLQ